MFLEANVLKILSNVYRTFFLKISLKFIGWLFIKCSYDCMLFHYMCHLKFNFWGHFNYMNIRIENQICKTHRVISWLWWINLWKTLFVPSYTVNCLRVFNFNEIIQNFIERLYLSIAHAWENQTHRHRHYIYTIYWEGCICIPHF